MRVPDGLHFIISGRIDFNILFPRIYREVTVNLDEFSLLQAHQDKINKKNTPDIIFSLKFLFKYTIRSRFLHFIKEDEDA